MKILITGASGFIGRNLSEAFIGRYDVCSPNRQELNLFHSESVTEYLKRNRFDVIIHAANVNTSRNKTNSKYDSLDGNLRMFCNLARCSQYYGKMYYFGSGAEYDMNSYIPNMEESYFGVHVPSDPYGFSKYIMSELCSNYNNIFDLRLFGVYGKYEEYERRFISNAICRALAGFDISINKNVFFDYLYIEDLITIMEWFIWNDPKYKHYNVCRGTKIDLLSLAKIVRECLDIDCAINIKEQGLKPEYTGNNQRLKDEIHNLVFTNYNRSIEELIDWYRIHWNDIHIEWL